MIRRLPFAILIVTVAAFSVWNVVPLTIADYYQFQGSGVLQALRRGVAVSAPRRQRLLALQRRAMAWSSSGQLSMQYGYTLLASKVRKASPVTGGNLAAPAARNALIAGLSSAPVSAEGWYWLAVANQIGSEAAAKSLSALRMSVYTGPHIPTLAVIRTRLMLRFWRQYKPDERQLVFSQIRYAWSVAPGGVIDLAMVARNQWPIRIALARDPKALQRFERKLAKAKERARK